MNKVTSRSAEILFLSAYSDWPDGFFLLPNQKTDCKVRFFVLFFQQTTLQLLHILAVPGWPGRDLYRPTLLPPHVHPRLGLDLRRPRLPDLDLPRLLLVHALCRLPGVHRPGPTPGRLQPVRVHQDEGRQRTAASKLLHSKLCTDTHGNTEIRLNNLYI